MTTSPCAYSQTTIEDTSDAPAAEEPTAAPRGPDWAKIEQVQGDLQAARTAQAARDAVAAAKAAKAEADRGREPSVFDIEPPDPATLPSRPIEPDRGPPLVKSQLWQGEPQGTAGPPERDDSSMWLAILAIFGSLAALAAIGPAERNSAAIKAKARVALASAGRWRRRNALRLVAAGAAIIAASLTVLRDIDFGYEYREWTDLIDAGWLTFGGAILTIIGFYDKFRTQPPPEI